MPAGPITDPCPNCGAPLELDETARCRWCHVPVRFAPPEADTGHDSQLMTAGVPEEKRKFRLLPPEICPSCGEDIESYRQGMCYSCGSYSRSRTDRVPHLIAMITVTLPLLEREPAIDQKLAGAPADHGAILVLTAAIADLGARIRDTYPDLDVRASGLRYLSAGDIWMLDLALDLMYMLAGELAGQDAQWLDDPGLLDLNLRHIDKATHDRRWKRALRQAVPGPAQFRQLRTHVPPRTSPRR
jgi:hypothetical protein